MNYTFELKELQATHIVYLHHQGDMSMIPSSIRKLMQWARPKGLINGPANKLISVPTRRKGVKCGYRFNSASRGRGRK